MYLLNFLNYGDWDGYIPVVIWKDSSPRNFKIRLSCMF